METAKIVTEDYLWQRAHDELYRDDLSFFALNAGIILEGVPFSFNRHEYLKEPYEMIRKAPEVIFEKAAQMGLSTLELLDTYHGARYGSYPHGVLYLLPSKTDVTEFSKSKAQTLVDENPIIKSWLQMTDTANVKRVGNSWLFFRGMQSRIGLKCHDNKTEVLTHEGWKLFKNATMKDEVATRSPSGSFMWQQVSDIACINYRGKMFHFKANGLDFCVTPNHRLLLTNPGMKSKEWIDTAERILPKLSSHLAVVRTSKDWEGISLYSDKFKVRGNKKNSRWEARHPDKEIDLKDWVSFLGIYVAEGCCSGIESGELKPGNGRVWISQSETSPHLKEIESLLKRMGFRFKYSQNNFRIGDMELTKLLFPLGDKYTKHLPQWVLDLPKEYLELIWEFALMGDGHITQAKGNRKPYRNYATVSKKLADQFQELLQKCGRSASILIQAPSKNGNLPGGRKAKKTSPLYLISERRSRCSVIPRPTEIDYDGMVYCVSVPNSVVYTRRNGYAFWSGNTITVDKIVFDEIEEIEDWTLVALAEERMSHIEEGKKFIHRLSVPSIPGYGVDAYFSGSPETGIKSSDQRFLHFQCQHCKEWTCFEDEWPDCIVEVDAKNEKAIRICKKCQRELPLTSKIEWIPKVLESNVIGYHFSQLFSYFVNPWKLLDQFRKKRELTTLFHDKLGIPYVEAEARLETKDILALCGSNLQFNAHPGPCAMGIDQPKAEGGKFHITIAYREQNQPCNVARICIRNSWNEVWDLMNTYNVSRCVIDALPDQAKAREFAKAHNGRVFLCYYSDKQKGAPKWNDVDWTVSVDRTESLNSSTRAFHESKVSLPRLDDEIKTFARHCHNMARKKDEDKDSGQIRHVWVKTGADHYRHSFNYVYLALPMVTEYFPVKRDRQWAKRERNWKTI